MKIPKGYQIHITTWENDADALSTQVISGLTEEDVNFYIDLARKFLSKNGAPDKRGFGNGSVAAADLVATVHAVLKAHPNVSKSVMSEWVEYSTESWDNSGDLEAEIGDIDVVADNLHGLLCDTVLGHPVSEYYFGQEYFCRVFDTYEVVYFTSPGKAVTSKFK